MSFYSESLEPGVLLLALITFPRVSQILEIVNRYTVNLHVPLKIIGKNTCLFIEGVSCTGQIVLDSLNLYMEVLTPVPQNVIAFGRGSSVTFLGEMEKSILPQKGANETLTFINHCVYWGYLHRYEWGTPHLWEHG